MDDNMDNNIDPANQSQAFLQRAQSQSTSILPSPALESGRQRTFLFFSENVTHPQMTCFWNSVFFLDRHNSIQKVLHIQFFTSCESEYNSYIC